MRFAVGGFQHETNTFAPVKTGFEDFVRADGWPALSRGEALFDSVEGTNLPIAGFVDAALAGGHALAPLMWCAAVPAAHVEECAYERIAAMILDDLARAGPVDGVYLDLHGAMVAEHLEDGEGELLARVRAVVGPAVPVVASLDLHANVTLRMVELADALVAYRTYPHVDMARTGARAAALLARMAAGARPAKAWRKLDFLIPLVWQCTDLEPARALYRRIEALEAEDEGLWSLSLCTGFAPADIRDAGPAVLAYGDDRAGADRAAEALAQALAGAEPAFAGRIYVADEAVAFALAQDRRPVVIADTQDNAGAGGNGDTVGMLRALVAAGAEEAVFAIVNDAAAAAAAHAAGEGAEIEIALGAASAWQGERPFQGRFAVRALGSGRFTATGPMFGGARMELGPMAVLDHQGIEVVVASTKMQAADQAMLRHLGIAPETRRILVLKSSVHFRADFAPIAAEVIVAASPGPNPVDHARLAYRRLRPGVRLMPLGDAYPGAA